MNSRICQAELMHARREPRRHGFRYPLYLYSLDLDELAGLDRRLPLFGYNRWRPAAVRDRDYLTGGDQPIAAKLRQVLDEQHCTDAVSRVQLVTAARYFGYVFNPASFFFCYGTDDELRYLVVQVRNTFGEMHLYVLRDPQPAAAPHLARFTAAKAFHVSPFFPRVGGYEFQVADVRQSLDVSIEYRQEDRKMFSARLQGVLLPLDGPTLARTMLRQPLAPVLTAPRILRQAASLYFAKHLPVFRRPPAEDPMTVRIAPAGPVQRLGQRRVVGMLGRIRRGGLQLDLPDGNRQVLGDPADGLQATLRVRDYRLFPRLLYAGDVGFGESYVDREWDSDDLAQLMSLLLRNWDVLDDRHIATARLGRTLNLLRHWRQRNTLRKSPRNIGAHYDLSNDFYRLFLDPSLTYSGAVYPRPDLSLEEAQQHKLRGLLNKARLREGEHLLEIGCGWGSCALLAAQEFGCRVTGVTLSREQFELARQRVREAGLADRIDIRLLDYRKIEGQFDKLVSIEMLEAVGHEYLGAFFATCDRLLRPEGLAVIQTITIPDQRYGTYRRSSDWIRKHIFPGGHLPSLTALAEAMTRSSGFVVEQLENVGVDYARTLWEWRQRLAAHREDALAQGFDDAFLRKWHYYFSYCEAGFRTRMLNNLQLVLTRPGNPSLPAAPYPGEGA